MQVFFFLHLLLKIFSLLLKMKAHSSVNGEKRYTRQQVHRIIASLLKPNINKIGNMKGKERSVVSPGK
uniref:Uncharacterized protein n=1 Tax=Arundo donax TaxID=35708 RepID=A0A0A9AE61_ARUDO